MRVIKLNFGYLEIFILIYLITKPVGGLTIDLLNEKYTYNRATLGSKNILKATP